MIRHDILDGDDDDDARRARFWCNLDGCGLLCVLTTWVMVLFSVYVVVFVLLRPVPLEECFSVTKLMISLLYTAIAGTATTNYNTVNYLDE